MRCYHIISLFTLGCLFVLVQSISEPISESSEYSTENQTVEAETTEATTITESGPQVSNPNNGTEGTDEYNVLNKDEQGTNLTVTPHGASGKILGPNATPATTVLYPSALYCTSTLASGSTRTCTMTLLTADYAITSASCVYDADSVSCSGGVAAGTGTAITGTPIVYPNYYSNSQNHNIALVKFVSPFTLVTALNVINLAYKSYTDEAKDLAGKRVTVVGYGPEVSGSAATAYSYQTMRVLSYSKCIKDMSVRNIRPSITQNCLDTESGTLGLCYQKDVGGPVIFRFDTDAEYSLVGVTNYYYSCGSTTPNLFTRIGPYWDWIRKYISVADNVG